MFINHNKIKCNLYRPKIGPQWCDLDGCSMKLESLMYPNEIGVIQANKSLKGRASQKRLFLNLTRGTEKGWDQIFGGCPVSAVRFSRNRENVVDIVM